MDVRLEQDRVARGRPWSSRQEPDCFQLPLAFQSGVPSMPIVVVIVTSVDIPMLQLLAIGLVTMRRGRRSSLPPGRECVLPRGGRVAAARWLREVVYSYCQHRQDGRVLFLRIFLVR